jgi:hypothetical protein
MCLQVSSVVEFWRWWVLKCKIFAQESIHSKEIFSKQFCNELWFVKKCRNCTFKVNFLLTFSTEFFQKKVIEEYQFRRPFFEKKNFSNFNLWTTLFPKTMPNLWQTGAPVFSKYNGFLWVYGFLAKRLAF